MPIDTIKKPSSTTDPQGELQQLITDEFVPLPGNYLFIFDGSKVPVPITIAQNGVGAFRVPVHLLAGEAKPTKLELYDAKGSTRVASLSFDWSGSVNPMPSGQIAIYADPARKPDSGPQVKLVEPVPRRSETRVNDFALVVGVGAYKSGVPGVEFAREDAGLFAAYARDALGIPAHNIHLLVDGDATQAEIRKRLRIIRNNIRGGRLYFCFAGHGSPFPNPRNPGEVTPYLVPYDGDPQYLEQTGISTAEVYDELEKSQAGEVIAFLDACFSGAENARVLLAKGARPLVLVDASENAAYLGKTWVLSATAKGQWTGSFPEARHGLFSYYLFLALMGDADIDRDGKVTLQEIASYVRSQVKEAAMRQNREQEPLFKSPPARSPHAIVVTKP